MSDIKFTPGPWEAKDWNRREVDILALGARVAGVTPWADPAQTMADARLIAAAPDLYAAVKDLLSAMEMQENRETGAFHIRAEVALFIWNEAKAKANAALAKVSP